MSVIRWEDPPESRKGKAGGRGFVRNPRWQAVADELRAHPGRWAVVAEGENAGISGHIRRGKYAAMQPAGSFEAQCVGAGGEFPIIYARYVGPVSTSPETGPEPCVQCCGEPGCLRHGCKHARAESTKDGT